MIKSYKIFENHYKLKVGDAVMIIYKDSKYYKKIGKIIQINKVDDCDVLLQYEDLVVKFYKTNLLRIDELIESPTGEIVIVSYEDRVYLAAIGLIQYDFDKQYHVFRSGDRMQIKEFEL